MSTIHDVACEQALLGAVLANPAVAGDAFRSVPKDAWWVPRHELLAAVIGDMLVRGQEVDPTTVLGQVSANGLLSKVDGTHILGMFEGGHYVPEHAASYAARIIELHGQRELVKAVQWVGQRLDEDWERGDGVNVTAAVAELRQACDDATAAATAHAAYNPTSLASLLEVEDRYNWLVPGLLERGERIVLTGAEGSGKSVLVSQFAATLCGGLHPFAGSVLGDGDRSIRVLVVDAENSEAQTRRRYRRLVRDVDVIRARYGLPPADWRNSFFVECRPEGLNLASGRDVTWLEHAVSATAPDLLVLGPLYRLHAGNMNDEQQSRELVHAIDSVRVRHNTALITEAHPGHSTDANGDRRMRPAGSSLWMRWPEFGFGIRRSANDDGLSPQQKRVNRERPVKVDVVAWRGSREARAWPMVLQHGQTLPWTPADPEYFDLMDRIDEF
jgi:hypothetical protein